MTRRFVSHRLPTGGWVVKIDVPAGIRVPDREHVWVLLAGHMSHPASEFPDVRDDAGVRAQVMPCHFESTGDDPLGRLVLPIWCRDQATAAAVVMLEREDWLREVPDLDAIWSAQG